METQFYKGKRRNALALGLLMLIAMLPSMALAATWTTEVVDAPLSVNKLQKGGFYGNEIRRVC